MEQQKIQWWNYKYRKKTLVAFKDYYISVYCEFKCNYILKAKLYIDYEIDGKGLYEITLNGYESIKISLLSRKEDYETLTVNVVGTGMQRFNAYLAKEQVSSANTLPSEPIFINGYYFVIK